MGIFIIENKDLSELVSEVNQLEKENKGRLVGSISNYNSGNESDGATFSGEYELYGIQPKNIYYATMRESKEEL